MSLLDVIFLLIGLISIAPVVYTFSRWIRKRRCCDKTEPSNIIYVSAGKATSRNPMLRQLENIQRNVLWHERILEKFSFNL